MAIRRGRWLLSLAFAAGIATAIPYAAIAGPAPASLSPVPPHAAYSLPLATVTGTGAVRFKITLGLLLAHDRTVVGLYRSYPSPTRHNLSEQYPLGMLSTATGAVLASAGATPLLVLRGHAAAAPGRYTLRLDYLQNAATHAYGHCALWLAHASGSWRFTTAHGAPVTAFRVRSGIAGIRGVTPCQRVTARSEAP